MVSSFTPGKRIEKPANNDYVDSWDLPVNANWSIIDLALSGVKTLNLTGLSGPLPLVATDYQPLKITATGAPTAATTLVIPSGVGGLWVVRNDTTGGFVISVASGAGGAVVSIPVGTNTLVTSDGTSLGMFYAINTPPGAGGVHTQVQFNNANVLAGSPGMTWDGTTLTATGLSVTGTTVLGDAAADQLSIPGTAVTAANGLNINTTQLTLGPTPYNKVGIASVPGADTLTVGGSIKSTAGGFVFPDATVQTTAASTPAGAIMAYGGDVAPPGGWARCDGQALSKAAFPALWNAIQYRFGGSGDSFNVPDLRGRVIAQTDGGTARLRAPYWGAEDPNIIGKGGGTDATQYLVRIPGLGVNVGSWGGGGYSASGYTTGAQSFRVYGNTAGSGTHGQADGFGSNFVGDHGHWYDGYYWTDGNNLNAYINSFGASGATLAHNQWSDLGINVQPTLLMTYIIKL